MQKISKKYLVFDCEVFPHWWCICFSTEEGFTFNVTSDNFDIMRLKILLSTYILVGFNIKNYDMKILDAIMNNNIPERIYSLSSAIIHETKDTLNNITWWNKYEFLDLFDDWKTHGSLKEFEANQGMSILESEISFDKTDLTDEEKEETIHYCTHDVEATLALLRHRTEYVNAKLALAELFEIEPITALKSTNAKLASIILKATKINRELETNYIIPERVQKYVYDNLPEDVIHMFDTLNKEEKTARLFDNNVVFGIGGIHSTYCDNLKVKKDKDYSLINVDVTSYYPNLLMKFNYMSRNVPDPKIYEKIYNLRVEYKRKANEEKDKNGKTDLYWKLYYIQAGLKLILNTVYGAMKNEYNALYDPYMAGSLCYTGQLLLASLANKMFKTLTKSKVIQLTFG